MRFSVLGPVTVSTPDGPVTIEAPKQRLLLAQLINRANHPVSPDSLIDLLWDLNPPSSARKALAWHVLQLRNALGGKERLSWRGNGYVLNTERDEVDAHTFEDRYREAVAARTTEPELAARLLEEALRLWRGPAYGELPESGTLLEEANRLNELRLVALEARCDIALELGRHGDIVPELSGLVADHPFREKFRASLMLALYRCGRQADALRVYREGRARLHEELGLEPGSKLRQLEQRVIRADPALEVAARPDAAPVPIVPAQLPADLRSFTGREPEVARLLELSTMESGNPGTIVVGALDGMAGIGKTTLAVHVAQRLASAYPGGQLFIDLHGFTEGVAPVDAGQALDRMLRALGIPPKQIPADIEDRSALYRSTLADRRLLIVLDNAADEAQVTPLLPGASGSLVLITSRRRLVGLEGTQYLQLDVLSSNEAVALLLRLADVVRPSHEQRELAAEIAALCGQLPLAIRIAAAKLRHRRHWSLLTIRDRLLDERGRLHQLELGERSVSAAFTMSYDDIDTETRRLFRILSLYPGAHFDVHVAAALSDRPIATVEESLDVLVDANLLSVRGPGRFGFHDLLRRFAAQAAETEPEGGAHEIAALRGRLLEYYRHTVYRVATTIDPGMMNLAKPAQTDLAIPRLPATEAAHSWYQAEHLNIFAIIDQAPDWELDEQVCQLVNAVSTISIIFSHHLWLADMCQRGLEAARRCGDKDCEARLLNHHALALRGMGRLSEAIALHEQSMLLRRELGDTLGEAAILNNIGLIHRRSGDLDKAIATYEQALLLGEESKMSSVHGLLHSNLAECFIRLEHFPRALDHVRLADNAVTKLGSERQDARIQYYYGAVYHHLGEQDRALRHYTRSLEYCERVMEPYGHASVLNGMANVHRQRGEMSRAIDFHEQALRLCRSIGDIDLESMVLYDLGRTHRAAGQLALAMHHLRAAATAATGVGDTFQRDRASRELAAVRDLLGPRALPAPS